MTEDFFVYKFTNKVNGWVYVGQTCRDPQARWNAHKDAMRGNYHHAITLNSDFKKYGEEAFCFEVIGNYKDYREMMNKEMELIKHYSASGTCYNVLGNTKEVLESNKRETYIKKMKKFNPFTWVFLAKGEWEKK